MIFVNNVNHDIVKLFMSQLCQETSDSKYTLIMIPHCDNKRIWGEIQCKWDDRCTIFPKLVGISTLCGLSGVNVSFLRLSSVLPGCGKMYFPTDVTFSYSRLLILTSCFHYLFAFTVTLLPFLPPPPPQPVQA